MTHEVRCLPATEVRATGGGSTPLQLVGYGATFNN
jgi:hypothetical protein